jgi:leader peptidase (prepilin peptidase)/N-methyltransferase
VDSLYASIELMPLWFWAITATLFGLAIGSFLNVVIYRVPRDEEGLSIAYPARSFCPGCSRQLAAWENIPVISYIILGGKCRNTECKNRNISLIYPFVEALTAAGFLLALFKQNGRPTINFAEWIFDSAFIAANIALIFIDGELFILPNVITLPGALLAFIARFIAPNLVAAVPCFYATHFAIAILAMLTIFALLRIFNNSKAFLLILALFISAVLLGLAVNRDQLFDWFIIFFNRFLFFWQTRLGPHPWAISFYNSLLGAIIGGGSLMFMRELYYFVRKNEGMGLGDIKMMLFVGAYLGWQLTAATLVVASFLGVLFAIGVFIYSMLMLVAHRIPRVGLNKSLLIAARKINRQGGNVLKMKIPFGVFLGAAAIILTIFGNELLNWYVKVVMPAS